MIPVRRLAWALIPLVGLIELGAHFFLSQRAPDPSEWRGLAPTVTQLRKAQELVVVAPYWAEPNARAAFGDALMPVNHVARPDESAFSRAIEVSIVGADAPELAGWQLEHEEHIDGFRLRVLSNSTPAAVKFNFVDNLKPEYAAVSERGQQPCPWNPKARVTNGALDRGHATFPEQRFDCKGKDWHFAGVTVVEDQNYRPRRCIWAQPTNGGALHVSFENVALGSRIYGYSGSSYFLERTTKQPMELEARVNDRAIGKHVHDHRAGWTHFNFAVESAAQPTGNVTFIVRPLQGKSNPLCFYADSR